MGTYVNQEVYQRYQKADVLVQKVCALIGRHEVRAARAAGEGRYKLAYQEQQRVSRLQDWYVKLAWARDQYWELAMLW